MARLLAASGKIVVAGEGSNAHGGTVALARYLPDGTLDPSFSGDGKQMTGEPGDDWVSIDYEAKAVRLMGSGRIVVAGSATYSDICCQSSEFLLLRYRPDGELDSSFGQDGRVSTRFHAGGDDSGAFDIARQADGRLVVVGWTQPIDWDSDFPEPAGPARFAVARYRADGSPDTTFSRDGKQTLVLGAPIRRDTPWRYSGTGGSSSAGGPRLIISRWPATGPTEISTPASRVTARL